MDVSERNKAIELLKEMRESREWNENQGNGTRLTWMYKMPSDLVDKEEYLLGKAIDKSFNADRNNDNTDLIGRSYEPSNVPKRLLAKPETAEQVDVAKKIHEDPLYAIKQKEMEARRKLLDNPVKLKELKKMIMERNLLKHERKQKKKKLKKDAMKDRKSCLDKLILKKLQILSENQRKKLLEEAAVSDSSDSNRKKAKKKRLRAQSSSESCSEEDSSDGSNDNKARKKKLTDSSDKKSRFLVHRGGRTTQKSRMSVETGKTNKKSVLRKKREETNRTRGEKKNYKASRERSSSSQSNFSSCSTSSDSSVSSSSSSSSEFEIRKKSKNIKMKSQTRSWKSSDRNKRIEKCPSKGEKWDKEIRNMKRHYAKSVSTSGQHSGDERNQRLESNQKIYDEPRASNFTHGHIESRRGRNYREKPQVSEKDRESALKEMMENAKLRKHERERNLADHRRIQTEEEKVKDYDDEFMRRQISHATSQGTVADRIRSNVNNIQRSKADMDRSFPGREMFRYIVLRLSNLTWAKNPKFQLSKQCETNQRVALVTLCFSFLTLSFRMRLKTTFLKNWKHGDIAMCLGWNNVEEVYSCGDDHVLMKWNSNTNECAKICDLPEDFYPTDMHWFPKYQSSGKRQSYELLLITSADGKFHLLHKNGRLEKSVEAHKGAALVGQWSYDGAGLVTAGEDGHVKIWSRSGMLRSTILQGDIPIYTAAWSADSNQVLIAQGRTLIIKPLAANSKQTRWRAHDGLILKAAWNKSNNLIISGGEDCKYKVWDAFGRQLYSSSTSDYPITSLAWAPGGELFVVGSYNTLRLCDKIGWSHSLDKPSSGTIYAAAWSPDGTQLAAACSNGNIILAHIIERRLEWKNYEVVLTSRKTITVKDVLNDTVEKLDFPERVTRMELDCYHLVAVSTMSRCHVFSTCNWNTPIIFDLKEGSVSLILLSSRHFVLVERTSITVYSYDGKVLNSPKISGMQFDTLDSSQISLSPDTLAVLDQNDEKLIHLLDISSGRQALNLSPVHHTLGIIKISLSQAQSARERQLAFVDRNRDVYVCYVHGTDYRKVSKLGVMVQSLAWNSEVNILAGAQDSIITVWLFPTALYVDKSVMRRTTLVKDLSECGRSLTLVSYINNHLSLRRLDGAMINTSLPLYYSVLHEFVALKNWDSALRLCRFVNDETLWGCLACMASYYKEPVPAEEAYAAISEFDKVSYLQYIKNLPVPAAQNAHLALFSGNFKEAENILLLNGLIFRAILIQMELHNWNRALELALKHRTHIDTVLYKRKCYLVTFDKTETNEKFIQFQNEVEIDPESIEMKIEADLAKEKENKT